MLFGKLAYMQLLTKVLKFKKTQFNSIELIQQTLSDAKSHYQLSQVFVRGVVLLLWIQERPYSLVQQYDLSSVDALFTKRLSGLINYVLPVLYNLLLSSLVSTN